MIVKKLRERNSWSQEQLATFSGLSLRTIQRVEAGNSASLETLKSLASTFEVEISKLKESVTVIDKETEKWRSTPWWITSALWGIRTRKTALKIEYVMVFIGVLGLLAYIGVFFSLLEPRMLGLNGAWFAAYWQAMVTRWLDNEKLW